MSFKKIELSELSFNPFEKFGNQWMLLTGGTMENCNTMTASWGQLGVLWNKNVLTCYIRPNRYTYDFVEKGELFTASFLGEEYRKELLNKEKSISLKEYILEHIKLMAERYPDRRATVEFRKFPPYYFKGMVGVKELKNAINQAQDTKELIELISKNL